MAWEKEWTDESTGVVANYWAVLSSYTNFQTKVNEKCIGVWISEDAFKAGKNPVYSTVESSSLGENAKLEADIADHAETVILAKEEFKDAKKLESAKPEEAQPVEEVKPK